MNIERRLLSLCQKSNQSFQKKILGVCTDSRQVKPDYIFVALKGDITNGHLYLKQAIQNGASALVVEDSHSVKNLDLYKGIICVVPSTQDILSVLLNDFYDYPSQKMFCVGVTGTNGKTTVSNMLSFIFSYCGWKTGLIGTIQNSIGKTQEKSVLTTPDSIQLYSLLNRFYQEGAQAVVMEVSSIGLDKKRVEGVDFNLGVFTNLSKDHLDYHLNMSHYYNAKKKLFKKSRLQKNHHFLAIINLDNSFGVTLAREINQPYISYGKKTSAMSWNILSSNLNGTTFELLFKKQKIKVVLPMPGLFNVSNAVAALCCATAAGFDLQIAVDALKNFPGVSGRLQKIYSPNHAFVFVDYAHTPQALESVLGFLKQNKDSSSKIFTVFGCGGQRDKVKRPQMAQIAEQFSDQVILTSDNPREEDPLQIIEDCKMGITNKKKCIIQIDRKKAIQQSLESAQKSDIVLIAGKGHEKKQIIGLKQYYFDDVEMVKTILAKL